MGKEFDTSSGATGLQRALMIGAAVVAAIIAWQVISSFWDRPHHTLKSYPKTPAGDLQWQADLIEEMLAIPCLDPELRETVESFKHFQYQHPSLVLDSIEQMESYLMAYDVVGCPEPDEAR